MYSHRSRLRHTFRMSSVSASAGGSGSAAKRRKLAEESNNQQSLLPGLPDHIARLCLSLLPPSTLFSVCRSWRRLIYSPSFPPFLSLYILSKCTNQTQNSNRIEFLCFDPISAKWESLPPVPAEPPISLLLRHPSFISRNNPIQTVAVAGNLVLLAATADQFLPALPRPLAFNPISRNWIFGPPLPTPRRWCAAGILGGAVYVASGIGSLYNSDVARSVEKWDLQTQSKHSQLKIRDRKLPWRWVKLGNLRDGKFSRDAIEAVGWRGKLYMVNVRGEAAKEGVVYNVVRDTVEDMPEGMLNGWRGPAAAMDEEVIYLVEESKGILKKYDPYLDRWLEIVESKMLIGAEQIAAGGGRVCVVCSGGGGIVAVDVKASPARLWAVDMPAGCEAVAVHILPRMCYPDLDSR